MVQCHSRLCCGLCYSSKAQRPSSLGGQNETDADSHTRSQEQDKLFVLRVIDIIRASEAPLHLGGGWLQLHQNCQRHWDGRYMTSFSACLTTQKIPTIVRLALGVGLHFYHLYSSLEHI